MGDIAEMMLAGVLCEICGVYLGKETGHPRQCKKCKKDAPPVVRPDPGRGE